MDLPDIILSKIIWYLWKHSIKEVHKEYNDKCEYTDPDDNYIVYKTIDNKSCKINFRDPQSFDMSDPDISYNIYIITTGVPIDDVLLPKYYWYSKRDLPGQYADNYW